MFMTLDKFLVLDNESDEIPQLISAKPSDTVGQVIQQFAKHKVHRLYVKDGTTTKGVITLSDVLALFTQ